MFPRGFFPGVFFAPTYFPGAVAPPPDGRRFDSAGRAEATFGVAGRASSRFSVTGSEGE